MTLHKRAVILIVLLSSLASIACTATAFEGIMCNLMGGEWVKDLDDPLAYEYYCIDEALLPDQSNPQELLEEETVQQNNSTNTDIYKGTTSLPALWEQTSDSGQLIDNEIIIIKNQNGDVSGSLLFNWQGGPSSPLEWEETPGGPLHGCITEISVSITGVVTGKLSEENNLIQIEMSQMQEIKRVDCPNPDEVFQDTDIWDAEITIDGDSLTGSIPGFFSFDAIRQ